jgi:hypothetical protein
MVVLVLVAYSVGGAEDAVKAAIEKTGKTATRKGAQ